MRQTVRILVLVAGLGTAVPGAMPGVRSQSLESGQIAVSLIERPIGQESYFITKTAAGFDAAVTLDLAERGGRLRLDAAWQLSADLTPRAYRASGNSYRFVALDLDVAVAGRQAIVREHGRETRVDLPPLFFIGQTYAPLVSRAWLISYWETHGQPDQLAVIPGRPTRGVRITRRGTNRVRADGRDHVLRRYTVDGAIWGRETVWLDDAERFAAITSRIHILPLEAVRDDLREALPQLLSASVADQIADLEAMSRDVKPVASGRFALVGARVIDGTGRPPMENATIVVDDGRIAAVGPRTSVVIPAGFMVVDATGTTVVPGLWDMHAHASQIEWAGAYLGAGVTSVRDMGGEFGFLTAFRDAIESGRAVGPKLYLAGLVDGDSDRALGAIVAGTPSEGRAVVDRYKATRFDQIKLYSLLAPDVARAIVDRAHEMGLTVTGHIPTSLGLNGAIEVGMDQIAHLPGGALAVANALAARGVVIDPTMPWGELLGRGLDTPIESFEPGFLSVPEPLRQNYLNVRNQMDQTTFAGRQRANGTSVKALFDAGVPIVVGTDGAVPGLSVLRNVEQFVDAGLTPIQALQAATLVPARAMRVSDRVGTIETGKRADLLVLDANPLDDVRNLRRSRWVAAAGVLYRTADWSRAAGFDRARR